MPEPRARVSCRSGIGALSSVSRLALATRNVFSLKLLGGASIHTSAGPLAGRAAQRRRIALLALLAVARGRGVSRDKLIAYLWPEQDAEHGRPLLSDSIYRVNQALGAEAVVSAGDDLRLSTDVLSSDVGDFEDAIERA